MQSTPGSPGAPRPLASSAPAPPPAPAAATETVVRPDPGLARGRWEAPAWAFWMALFVILAAAATYALRRLGVLRLGYKGKSGE